MTDTFQEENWYYPDLEQKCRISNSLPYTKRNFTMIEKIGAVHLIKSYGSEDKKYLLLPKCGTKYQKVRPDTNLI